MKRLLLVIPLALALAGCQAASNVQNFLSAATTTITNPVTTSNVYQAELAFNISVKAANKWAAYCWSQPYVKLMADPVAAVACKNRRTTRRALSAAGDKAQAAIKVAQTFIKNNPTISPLKVVDDAWSAVNSYGTLVAQHAVP